MDLFPIDDLSLKDWINEVSLMNNYNPIIQEIVQNIYDNDFDTKNRDLILNNHNIEEIEYLKYYAIAFIIDYIKFVLNDYVISEKERCNVALLKHYFKIKEGDFYKYRYIEIIEILHRQFEKIYEDGIITDDEEIHKFEVQDLFDLSYDQFLEIKENYLTKTGNYVK